MSTPVPGAADRDELPVSRPMTYETALDILGISIVCYSVLIEQEERRPTPDTDAIAGWDLEIGRIAGLRHTLDRHDEDEVRRVAEEHAALARRLDAMIEDR